MTTFSLSCNLICIAVAFAFLARPAAAFGAGNIGSLSAIEGQNWRHGDIEDTLLTLVMARACGGQKFGKLDVARVYFGNWLRDYSQAVDVGTVKYVSAEAIRLILWVLGFMTFGYGTGEFEVTYDRLGVYRPEEHIDNPKDYADNLDARQYDRRLRGPVDERRELSINPQTGLKNYIATENIGINTSARLVRHLFGTCIQLGRKYTHSRNKADLYEALRLLGTGCHCLEDYAAHSNYTELCLIELGEQNIFPHVGRQTKINLQGSRRGPVYPIVTGTFGGVDFLYSVIGEFGDRASQSELDQLQGLAMNSQSGNSSMLHDLFSQIPSAFMGGEDQAGKADQLQANAQAAQAHIQNVSPRQPEAWAKSLQEVQRTIYPILEWHDQILQSIKEFIEKIPILPQLIDQIQNEINIFVFSLLAPLIIPIMEQVKTELNTGSSEIIQSSKAKQFIVFSDDHSTNPTHSMLSKDHFSNILNEPAGKVASQILKWVVPQIMECWDNESIDVNRTLNRIINGVLHHPAQKDMGDDGAVDGRRLMFGVMQHWWGSKSERDRAMFRDQLSRDGVQNGRNQKAGIHDTGHGCGVPLSIPGARGIEGVLGGAAAGGILGEITAAFEGQSRFDPGARPPVGQPARAMPETQPTPGFTKFAEQAAGVGLGAVIGGLGAEVLGHAFSGHEAQTQHYQTQKYGQDGSYTQNYVQTSYNPSGQQPAYGQAEYSQTNFPGGAQREEYQRYQQEGAYGQAAFGETVISNTRPMYGGGFEQTTEVRRERPGGSWESEVTRRGEGIGGAFIAEEIYEHEKHKKHHKHRGEFEEDEVVIEEPRRFGGETVIEEDRIYGRGPGYREEVVEYGSGRQAQPFVEEVDIYNRPTREEVFVEEDICNRNRRGPEEFVEERITTDYGRQPEEFVEERVTTDYGGGYGRQEEFVRERDDFVERREDVYDDRRGGFEEDVSREEVFDDRRGGFGEEEVVEETDIYRDDGEEFVEREERNYEY